VYGVYGNIKIYKVFNTGIEIGMCRQGPKTMQYADVQWFNHKPLILLIIRGSF